MPCWVKTAWLRYDEPGTTRDSISIDLEKNGKHYTLIDTAGVRKRGRVLEAIEKFSVIKTIQSIEEANVVILVVDAQEGITEARCTRRGLYFRCGSCIGGRHQ